ncbi:GNAT family N-acetyltransferase [Tabrizicola sp.]|uniref:GNAT family N-acetyltransferase n=1 Tax=Tabrizicola sp. TaxID=2005166 RepID=UPI003F3A6084
MTDGRPTFQLRLTGPKDAATILAADVFDGPARPESVTRYLGAPGAPDPRNILILAEIGKRIVGFASGTVTDHPDKPRALFINELGVNEDAQRRGIGRALLAAIRAEGRAQGCEVSWVLTEADNAPARAVYASAGGQETTGVVMFEWEEGEADL